MNGCDSPTTATGGVPTGAAPGDARRRDGSRHWATAARRSGDPMCGSGTLAIKAALIYTPRPRRATPIPLRLRARASIRRQPWTSVVARPGSSGRRPAGRWSRRIWIRGRSRPRERYAGPPASRSSSSSRPPTSRDTAAPEVRRRHRECGVWRAPRWSHGARAGYVRVGSSFSGAARFQRLGPQPQSPLAGAVGLRRTPPASVPQRPDRMPPARLFAVPGSTPVHPGVPFRRRPG